MFRRGAAALAGDFRLDLAGSNATSLCAICFWTSKVQRHGAKREAFNGLRLGHFTEEASTSA